MAPGRTRRAPLAKYNEQRDDLYEGNTPRPANGALTVRDLVNQFLTSKKQRVIRRELKPRSFAEYRDTCAHVIAALVVLGEQRIGEARSPAINGTKGLAPTQHSNAEDEVA